MDEVTAREIAAQREDLMTAKQVQQKYRLSEPSKASQDESVIQETGIPKGRQMSEREDGPCCSHITVRWTTEDLLDGSTRGWWECSDCRMMFGPSGNKRDWTLSAKPPVQQAAPNEEWWDQHAVQCGNCSVEILTRKGSIPNNNGLSDTGDSEDEALCGRCAGAQMYIYMDELDAPKQAAPEPPVTPAELPVCAAIRYQQKTISDGENLGDIIIAGRRHGDCLRSCALAGLRRPTIDQQGFMTTLGRFVDRMEAMTLMKAAGRQSADPSGFRGDELMSEDLY